MAHNTAHSEMEDEWEVDRTSPCPKGPPCAGSVQDQLNRVTETILRPTQILAQIKGLNQLFGAPSCMHNLSTLMRLTAMATVWSIFPDSCSQIFGKN